METRKLEEIAFHDTKRGHDPGDPKFEKRYPNLKYYSVVRGRDRFVQDWLLKRCPDKRVLVYGCGAGAQSFYLAKAGATVLGIDISEVSVHCARRSAIEERVDGKAHFVVMDCENLAFGPSSLDVIIAAGVLHHLDLTRAFVEMCKVLKPSGEIICIEALGHNPLIRLYRKMTPHLRTKWEAQHILRVDDLDVARKYFDQVEVRFFHLVTLLAVPFRKTRVFDAILSFLEMFDALLLRIPFVRRQAWQMIFVLSQPRKESLRERG